MKNNDRFEEQCQSIVHFAGNGVCSYSRERDHRKLMAIVFAGEGNRTKMYE